MSTWLTQPLAVLDTETTGTDPESARIVSVYVGRVEAPGAPLVDLLDLTVNPGVPIPAEATAIHGITDEQAARGVPADEAARHLSEALRDLAVEGVPVVGHNLAYDVTLAAVEIDRHAALPLRNPNYLDTLVLFRRFDYTTGGRTLEALANRHGITFPAHNAKADAFASLRLLHILCDQNDLLEHAPIAALQGLQAKWHAAQQEAAYWKRRGNGRNDPLPSIDWPLKPAGVAA